jgi:tol-pal system protein YbgF
MPIRSLSNAVMHFSALGRTVGCLSASLMLASCTMMPGSQDINQNVSRMKLDLGRMQTSQNEEFRKIEYTLAKIQEEQTVQRELLDSMSTDSEERMVRIEREIQDLKGGAPSVGMVGAASAIPMGAPGAMPQAGTPGVAPTADTSGQALLGAQTAYSQGDYDKAIQLYEQFIGQYPADPKTAEASSNLGRCYFQKDDFERARAAFDRVVREYPGNQLVPQCMHSRALCEIKLNRNDQARQTLQSLQATYPDYDPERIANILKNVLGTTAQAPAVPAAGGAAAPTNGGAVPLETVQP